MVSVSVGSWCRLNINPDIVTGQVCLFSFFTKLLRSCCVTVCVCVCAVCVCRLCVRAVCVCVCVSPDGVDTAKTDKRKELLERDQGGCS